MCALAFRIGFNWVKQMSTQASLPSRQYPIQDEDPRLVLGPGAFHAFFPEPAGTPFRMYPPQDQFIEDA